MTAVNRQLGVNSAIVLKFGTADQATIKGLNSLTLPAMTRSKIKSEEFGVDFAVNDVGGGEHGDIQYSGNMIFGDTKGQDQLRAYLLANTKFTDARIYLDTVLGHFLAPDTFLDAATGFQVIAHTPGAVNKNGTYPFSGSWSVNGLYAYFIIHRQDIAAPTLGFVTSATPLTVGGTITDSTSQFVINGFVAGQTLICDGATSAANKGVLGTIKTVAAGLITMDIGAPLATEASPGVACSLHAGKF